ncbi:MAG: hypothetical protein HY921_00650 [Elusimicrobia bacterium]|nr:hypothetical protein [Elusimicrobiota bacterium]
MRKRLSPIVAGLILGVSTSAWGGTAPSRLPRPTPFEALARPEFFPEARMLGTSEESGPLYKELQAVAASKAGSLPAMAGRYSYLLIPGISWDLLPGYLKPNLGRLTYLGLEGRFVPTDPLGPAADNAEVLASAIEEARMPVVALTHSKGGTDFLEALRLRPSLQSRVRALVTLQTPHWGTPTADWALSHPWLYHAAMLGSRLLVPSRLGAAIPRDWMRAVEELSQAYRAERAADGSWLDPGIRLFSMATWSSSGGLQGNIRSRLIPELYGRQNDGIIPTLSQIMPGSRFAVLGDVNHQETVYAPSPVLSLAGARIAYTSLAADLTEAVVRWIFTPPGSGA